MYGWIFCVSFFFFSSRRRHTRSKRDWSSDVCSSDLGGHVYKARTAKDMEPMLQAIAKDLQNGYMLGFAPPEEERAVAWHELQVLIKDRSEERRVGKESRGGGGREYGKENRLGGDSSV